MGKNLITKYGRLYTPGSAQDYDTLERKDGDVFEAIYFGGADNPVSIRAENGAHSVLRLTNQDSSLEPLKRAIESLPRVNHKSKEVCQRDAILATVVLVLAAIRPVLGMVNNEAASVLQAVEEVIASYPASSLAAGVSLLFGAPFTIGALQEHNDIRKFRSGFTKILDQFNDQAKTS